MKILLIGAGGREHALAWQLAQSDRCRELYCAPGNAGIEECAECIDIQADDSEALVAFAIEKAIDLVVVGPEGPLVAGLTDRLHEKNIAVFGPTAAAAQLEGSKGFMKDLCTKYNIPTAAYSRFTVLEDAKEFITAHGVPLVIKADGLAAGKGVIIAATIEDAEQAAEDMLSGTAFGQAGQSIVIEEFMDGEELSVFALADGKTVIPFSSAQDHKRVGEGDTGPNTGGMGAYSPAHMMTEALEQKIYNQIMQPTIDGMAKEGCPFTGVLFAGIILVDGEPKLLEFNVRFGDPECQTLMMRLDYDLLDILTAGAKGLLTDVIDEIYWREDTALCVVMAAQGYPDSYEKNTLITGIDAADVMPETKVFHAGTKRNKSKDILNTGGRVLGITSRGETISTAQINAYKAVEKINWPKGFFRRDIGWHALKKDQRNIATKSISC